MKKCEEFCKKKNLLIGGLAFLLLLLISYPFVMGKIIENKFQDSLVKARNFLGSSVEVNSQYEKGAFSSKAHILMTFRPGVAGPLTIKVDSDFSHFTGNVQSTLQLDPELGKAYLETFDHAPKMDVATRIHFFGGFSNHFTILPFKTKVVSEEGMSVDFDGMKGDLVLTSGLDPKYFEVSMDGVKIKDGLRIRLLKQFGLILRIDRGTQIVDTSLEFFFDKYDDLEQYFGPGILEIKAKNLDSESLDKIQKTLSEFRSNPAGMLGEDMKMKMMMSAMGILPNFLKRSPSFEISNLKLKTINGDLLGNAKIQFQDTEGGFNPMTLLSKLQVLVEGVAPLAVVNSLAEQIIKLQELKNVKDKDALKGDQAEAILKELTAKAQAQTQDKVKEFLEKKYLVETKNGLSFRIEWKNGSLILNERPFSMRL